MFDWHVLTRQISMWGSFWEEITMFDLCSVWVARPGCSKELGYRGKGQICLGGHCYRKRLRGPSSSRNSYVFSMSSPTMSPKSIRYGYLNQYWNSRAMFSKEYHVSWKYDVTWWANLILLHLFVLCSLSIRIMLTNQQGTRRMLGCWFLMSHSLWFVIDSV